MTFFTINWNGHDRAVLDFAIMHLAQKDDAHHVELELAEDNPHAAQAEHPFVTGYLRAAQADAGDPVTVHLHESDDRGERTGNVLTFPADDVLSLEVT